MKARPAPRPPRQGMLWLWPAALVCSAAAFLFLGLYGLDYLLGPRRRGMFSQLFQYDLETAQNALGNLAQVVVSVLGLVITVVSIVVQLAANRYTPRITDLFFRDRTNLVVLGFFVTTCIAAVWVSLSVEKDLVPARAITGILILVTVSLLLVIPYFAYVFNFLDPSAVVGRIRDDALRAATDGQGDTRRRQQEVLLRVEQLGDIAVNAVSNRDKLIASGAVDALKDLAVGYLACKERNAAEWFTLGETLRRNPDFVSMDPGSLGDLEARGTWLEWKILRQLQSLYGESLQELPDICYLVAIDARYIGEAALAARQGEGLRLTVKFFNTFLRAALNTQKVRAAYNLLNQYRLLAESVLSRGEQALLVELAGYLRYYAQTAHKLHLGFVTETVAYDLAVLCEAAFVRRAGCHEALLRTLLMLDQAAETEAQEVTLRGVRKAQVKLATGYLMRGAEAEARQIFADMHEERPERLRSIRDELMQVESKDFWEIIDRGTNFDYLDPERKAQLAKFFSWFPSL